MNSDDTLTVSQVRDLNAERERFWHRAAFLFLLITSLLRLCLLPMTELAADEAYYWDWSRHLSLGYYDQGPFIAYLIRFTTTLFGNNELGVRVGVWAMSAGTLACIYSLTRRFASSLAGFLAVLFLALTPLLTAGSLIATYDTPLVFFWALSLVALERALFATDTGVQNRAWLSAGVWSGLGLLSKHTMLLIVPCLLLFLLLSGPVHRHWLWRPQPYLAFLITLLLYSGVFWWNATHHWWTFGHLLFLAGKSNGTPLRQFGDLIGSQALILGPGLFAACLWVCWGTGREWYQHTHSVSVPPERSQLFAQGDADGNARSVPQDVLLFLFCFGFPVIAFFCLVTLKAKVQANWASCAWITPTMAVAIHLAGQFQQKGHAARRALWQTVTITLISGVLTLLMLSPWLRGKLGIRQKAQDDIANKMTGARIMASEVDAIRAEMRKEGRPVFIAGNDYQTCALLAFYLPDHPQTFDLFLGYRLNYYAADIDTLKAHLGENAIYVNESRGEDAELHTLFDRMEWAGPFPIWRRPYFAQPIRSHYYGRCYHYTRFIGLTQAHGG